MTTSEKVTKGSIPAKQQLAAVALASGKTVKAAASAAQVTPKTVAEWKGHPAFVSTVRQLQQEAFDEALVELRRATARAVKTADKLLGHADPKVKLGAARMVLGASLKVTEVIDLAERVAALEASARAAEERNEQ